MDKKIDLTDKFIKALIEVLEMKYDVKINYKIKEVKQTSIGGQAMKLAKKISKNKDTIKTVTVFYLMLIVVTLIVIHA